MISMKVFLTEVFNQPYPFKKTDNQFASKIVRDNVHDYKFTTDNGQRYNTQFLHHSPGEDGKNTHAELTFSSGGSIGQTGKQGASAHKVFSTVHHVIKHHLDQHKDQDSIQFSSTNKHPDEGDSQGSRTKLYRHLAKRFSNKHREFDPYGDNSETAFHIKRQDIK